MGFFGKNLGIDSSTDQNWSRVLARTRRTNDNKDIISETEIKKLDSLKAEHINNVYSQVNLTLLGNDSVFLPNGQNLADWAPPEDFQTRFVYYLAGYDEDNRPIWIAELGRWNIKKVIEDGYIKEFDLFVKQLAHLAIKSIYERSSDDFPVDEAICVLDFADLKMEQLRHQPTVRYVLGLANEFQSVANKYLGEAIVINTNFAAETLMNLVKPILGGLFERITVYGNNKSQWIPKLLRKLPRKYVPEWYGGSKDFKPLKIYG
ncbi:unnamed protein product [Allacma fusca]|uniref:CRAL-TRIO domain-containing protein n=1 Tax=Allacma fusca TaxID=39272 RepID=A0A8J2J021_9HEXA|nr:unnamed protein product [Allacma fusca]